MKFCKKYQEYMHKQEKQLPGLGFKNLKKILKRCKRDFQTHKERDGNLIPLSTCPDKCTVCDGTFFPPLLKEMSAVVGCFNERAKKLLELHLASGFRKYLLWFRTKQRRDHETLIENGRDLVDYAMVNAIAIRKILKKYDKIHHSKQGQAIKSQAQSMHIEILQSPWLYELLAFHINLSESKVETRNVCGLFDHCSLKFDGGRLSLSCAFFDPFRLDIDLTCSICLDTLFDPICVTCGHIFCYMCACSAASVTIVDGLNNAEPKLKCPLCRQEAVYGGAMHLVELNIFLSQSFPEYWSERIKMERAERMRQVKEHWDSQCRAFTGI